MFCSARSCDRVFGNLFKNDIWTFLSKRSWCDFPAWIAKSQELKGCEQVVSEYGGPAEEEDRHDQDQHVDHLDHQDDGDRDEDDEQVLSKNMILYI